MLGSCVTSSSELIVFAARTDIEYSSDFNSSTISAIFFRIFLGVEGLVANWLNVVIELLRNSCKKIKLYVISLAELDYCQ